MIFNTFNNYVREPLASADRIESHDQPSRKNGLRGEKEAPLVQSIVEQIEERRKLLQAQAEADASEQQDETRKGVMTSIRKFFGLR